MNVLKAKASVSMVVYRSLQQVWTTLGTPELLKQPEVQEILSICRNAGIVGINDGIIYPKLKQNPKRSHTTPFVVIEGLDGTGKTTLTKMLSKKMGMKLFSTPPKPLQFQNARKFFDEQPESVRRAYYSLGNYLAAEEVMHTAEPVVMDRYWHSTAAYAFAHLMKSGEPAPLESDLVWPSDLLQPDLVLLLNVSEQERIHRHQSRRVVTDTEEERILAQDQLFRQNLVEYYKKIVGPCFEEVNVDGKQITSEAKVLSCVTNHFPNFLIA